MIQKWHLTLLPSGCALIAAMIATGFPFLPGSSGSPYDEWFRQEVWVQQMAAIASALVASIVIVLFCRPRTVWPMVIASHFLWVHPFWAFHHDYTIGIFGWLFMGGEDGFIIFPNLTGLSITLGLHYCLWKLLSSNESANPMPTETECDGR